METGSTPKHAGGRPKGSLNKSTAEVKKLAQKYSKRAIQTLVKLMESDATPEQAKVAAARELLDRGHGRAPQAVEVSGPEGGPIQAAITVEFVRPNGSGAGN